MAKRRGFIINIDVERIKIKQHRSHRTNLTIAEVELMKEYYLSKSIKESHKKTLGYFLFNCMTGLRINDLLKLKRDQLNEDFLISGIKYNRQNQK